MNLKKHDLVNLAMARRAGAKVILVADIDAGGVFAQVVGSLKLITPAERRLVCGIVVNKFRGDPALFADGVAFLEKHGQKTVLGVLPMFSHISLPQEDGVALERGQMGGGKGDVRVGVIRLSHISNYTDADALAAQAGVELRWVERPAELAGLDLLILPGTKNTLAALRGLHKSGLFAAARAYHELGGRILGLCGGYQLLGKIISDPDGVEGPPGSAEGLGLLPMETVMAGDKATTRVRARCMEDLPFFVPDEVTGYEIHMGRTQAIGSSRPALTLTSVLGKSADTPEGQISRDGRVVGTYLHGFLDNDRLRSALLAWARGGGEAPATADYAAFKDRQYDLLADLLEEHLGLDGLLEPMG